MGALGPALDALPEEFPELPVDLPASDCPYVNALRDALARQLAGPGNALGHAGTALGAANSLFEQAGSALDDADALAVPAVAATHARLAALEPAHHVAHADGPEAIAAATAALHHTPAPQPGPPPPAMTPHHYDPAQ